MSIAESVVPQRFHLSGNQQRLWAECDNAQHALIQVASLMEGALDVQLLKSAIRRVVEKHEIFRTRLDRVEGIKFPFQVVLPEPAFSWDEVRGDSAATPESLLTLARGRFSWSADSSLHVLFAPLRSDAAVVVFTLPALCGDMGTLDILIQELAGQYGADDEAVSPVETTSVQYIQFSEWQRSLLEDEETSAAREYWKGKLNDIPRGVEHFPFEASRAFHPHRVDGVYRTGLSREHASRTRAIAEEIGVDCEAVLFASWSYLLWRVSGMAPCASWVNLSGRDHEMLSSVCGPLTAAVPACLEWDTKATTSEVIALSARLINELKEWVFYYRPEQFEEQAFRELRVGFECERPVHCVTRNGVRFSKLQSFCCPETVHLKLVPSIGLDGLAVQIYFNSARFSLEHVREFASMFEALIQNLDARKCFAGLELVSEEVTRSTAAAIAEPASANLDRTLVEMFEEQVERTPDETAVIGKDLSLTFAELNRKANRVANYLVARGTAVDDRVALCLERTAEVVVGILGILKASAAYVPLDPGYPRERLKFVLHDAACRIVLTQQSLLGQFEGSQAEILCLDGNPGLADIDDHNPPHKVCPENLAYLIYTSGSTGRPKGVMIRHRSVINLLESLGKALWPDNSALMRVGINAPIVFDASVKQWIQILKGHTVCIVPEDARLHPESFAQYIQENRIDLLDTTPSHFKLLMEHRSLPENKPKIILLGGEAIDDQTWRDLQGMPDKKFCNVYGPTECTVDASAACIAEVDQPSIGRALQGVQLYVLNESLNPVPMMLSGELYIGGEGLARGYWNQPALTAERFIPNPFSEVPGERLYRTGDLVCRLPGGVLKFMGRVDDQVKIRGYRLELGEIASVLRNVKGVRDAFVTIQGEAENRRLAAYVVREAGQEVAIKQLKHHAQQQLPDYMVPAGFAVVDRLPLNINGKVDRSQLPVVGNQPSDESVERAGPRGETEKILTTFWQQILGSQKFGIHDNFFDLGGNSLLMVQLHKKIQEKFKKSVPMVELFRNPTIATLAQFIGQSTTGPSLSKAKQRAANRIAAANRIN